MQENGVALKATHEEIQSAAAALHQNALASQPGNSHFFLNCGITVIVAASQTSNGSSGPDSQLKCLFILDELNFRKL